MIYAQINNGVVKNCIVIEDDTLIPLFKSGFEYFIQIDILNDIPGLGWAYDGQSFVAPQIIDEPNPTPESVADVKNAIANMDPAIVDDLVTKAIVTYGMTLQEFNLLNKDVHAVLLADQLGYALIPFVK